MIAEEPITVISSPRIEAFEKVRTMDKQRFNELSEKLTEAKINLAAALHKAASEVEQSVGEPRALEFAFVNKPATHTKFFAELQPVKALIERFSNVQKSIDEGRRLVDAGKLDDAETLLCRASRQLAVAD